ncbi:phosphotransferase [Glutamicibacter sp.]|uniref:phosphotransferase n=1 Tax=Glutamicibacter sp. TaxID=1931995 RepID=UPI0028BD8E43|nr:phosphotransferase [Glutamicibacter sp.]
MSSSMLSTFNGLLRERLNDPLRRSSDALIIGTGLTSLLGLAFWALAARWLSTESVGIGAAVVSAVTLLANIATLGMRNGFLRFLPTAGSGTLRFIFTTYTVCALAAIAAAGVFLAGQPLWGQQLGFLTQTPLSMAAFILGTVVWVIFVLQDQVLIGLRHAGWVPLENGLASVLKIAALPVFAFASLWAVFAATVVPSIIVVLAVTVLIRQLVKKKLAASAAVRSEPTSFKTVLGFVVPDHFASMLWFATTDVLTLIVLNVAGPEASAYWYMANTIGYSLYLVTSNVGSALISESVHDPANAYRHARKALRHSAQLVLPAAVIGILLSSFALGLLGEDYAQFATGTLQLILASAVPQLIVGIGIAMARVRGDMLTVLGVYAFTALMLWGGSTFAIELWGLPGIGIMILLNQSLVAVFFLASGRSGLWPDAEHRSLAQRLGEIPRALRRRSNNRSIGQIVPGALASCGVDTSADIRLLTSNSDTLVIAVAAREGATDLVLKVGTSEAANQGIAAHSRALQQLSGALEDPELLGLLPKIVAHRELEGNQILLETRLVGAARTGFDESRLSSGAALATMSALHRATGVEQLIDDAWLEQMVRRPLRVLAQELPGRRAHRTLKRTERRLVQELVGRQVHSSFIHGDLWPGNILFADSDEPRVQGIVDWENAAGQGLPDADILHWWLAVQPKELGGAVVSVLHDASALQSDLAGWDVNLPNQGLGVKNLLVLTWLMHVAAGLNRASTHRVGRVWIVKNVLPVLRALR